jgi:hypothetical protein
LVTTGVGRGWDPNPIELFAAKYKAVEGAGRLVDPAAMGVLSGAGMFTGNELDRLYRDVRCSGFHPGDNAVVQDAIGKGCSAFFVRPLAGDSSPACGGKRSGLLIGSRSQVEHGARFQHYSRRN